MDKAAGALDRLWREQGAITRLRRRKDNERQSTPPVVALASAASDLVPLRIFCNLVKRSKLKQGKASAKRNVMVYLQEHEEPLRRIKQDSSSRYAGHQGRQLGLARFEVRCWGI